MKGKILVIFIVGLLVFTLMSYSQQLNFPSRLKVADGVIKKILQIDEYTALLLGRFPHRDDISKEDILLYVFNVDKKYKILLMYQEAYTENEKAIFGIEGGPEDPIGPVGPSKIKRDYVTWVYDPEDNPVSLIFKHYQDFNIETRKGRLVAKYEVNLIELAQELNSKSPPSK